MKKLTLSIILLATITATHGQGMLVFANLASGVNAPVSLAATGERIRDPLFLADLYFSTTTNAPTETLQPAGLNVPFSTTTSGGGGGYFLGGIKTLTNVPGGTTIQAQVRVWNSTNSPGWNPFYPFGHSVSFLVTLTQPPASAPSLIGLTSFAVGFNEPPSITKQPLTQNAAVGATVYFGVRAKTFPDPELPVFFQWSFKGISLPGATEAVLELTNVQPTQEGAYQVRVSTILGYTFSSFANLGVVDTALEAPVVPALVISNGVGSNFVLRYSASVSPAPVWLNLASLTPTNNPQLYVDGSATNAPARIYRLVQVP